VIGVASATGQPLSIPILLRSFSAAVILNDWGWNGFNVEPEMWVALDVPLPATDPAAVVDSYQGDWWTAHLYRARTRMTVDTLGEWVNYHHSRNKLPSPKLPGIAKPHYTWAREIFLGHTSEVPWAFCYRCRLYRSVAVIVITFLQELCNMVKALGDRSEGSPATAFRKTYILYKLHKAATAKASIAQASDAAPAALSMAEAMAVFNLQPPPESVTAPDNDGDVTDAHDDELDSTNDHPSAIPPNHRYDPIPLEGQKDEPLLEDGRVQNWHINDFGGRPRPHNTRPVSDHAVGAIPKSPKRPYRHLVYAEEPISNYVADPFPKFSSWTFHGFRGSDNGSGDESDGSRRHYDRCHIPLIRPPPRSDAQRM